MDSSSRPNRTTARSTARCVALGFATLLTSTAAAQSAPSGLPEAGQKLVPTGPEFQVNTYTTGSQFQPRIARHDSGFVMVWSSTESPGTDNSSQSVQGRRYSLDGTSIGDQFQVNSYTPLAQNSPEVAAWPDGRFLVVWFDQANAEIKGQVFHSDGTLNGEEFAVSSYLTGNDFSPNVIMTESGEPLVVWSSSVSPDTDTSDNSILARRLDSSGFPTASDFQVNSYTTDAQNNPDLAQAPDGTFVVVWSSYQSPGDDPEYSIQMRRLASDGTPMAADLQVNSYTPGYSYSPKIAIGNSGNFVVAWNSYDLGPADQSYGGVVARRFGSDGTALAPDFQVNSFTTSYQYPSDVAFTPDGGFLISWDGMAPLSADTDGSAVLVSRYDSNGALVGGEMVVNSLHTGDQYSDGFSVDDQGNFVVLWQSDSSAGTDTSNNSIQARFFVTEADISVTKTDGLSTAVPGETTVTYTIVVTNNGPDAATGVTVTDVLDKSLSCDFTSLATNGAMGNTVSGSGGLSETGLMLPNTADVTYTLTCSVDPSATGTLINTVDVAVDQNDAVAANDSATDMTSLEPSIDLSASLSVNRLDAVPGETLTLSAGVANGGPSAAGGGSLTVELPTGLIFQPSAGCTEGSGTVTCPFGSLPPSSSSSAGISVLVDDTLEDGTPLTVTQSVTGNEPDSDSGNDQAMITLTVATPIFADGFESGDTSAWTSANP